MIAQGFDFEHRRRRRRSTISSNFGKNHAAPTIRGCKDYDHQRSSRSTIFLLDKCLCACQEAQSKDEARRSRQLTTLLTVVAVAVRESPCSTNEQNRAHTTSAARRHSHTPKSRTSHRMPPPLSMVTGKQPHISRIRM
jgi:hypothetical protein